MSRRTGARSAPRDWSVRYLVCPVIGHRWGRRLAGRVCTRCGVFEGAVFTLNPRP